MNDLRLKHVLISDKKLGKLQNMENAVSSEKMITVNNRS